MATFFLVRHAAHDLLDRVLVGRSAGARLGEKGRFQAERLAERFSRERISSVQASPRERAVETAEPIAARVHVALSVAPAADEIDCGDWTGQPLERLRDDPAWRHWNASRSTARAPGGESMQEAQQRIVDHLQQVCAAQAEARVVIVSHADIIRAAILYCLDVSLDLFHRLEVAPASISTMVMGDWGCKLLGMNEQVAA